MRQLWLTPNVILLKMNKGSKTLVIVLGFGPFKSKSTHRVLHVEHESIESVVYTISIFYHEVPINCDSLGRFSFEAFSISQWYTFHLVYSRVDLVRPSYIISKIDVEI